MNVEQNLLIGFVRDIQRFGLDDIKIWSQFAVVLVAVLIAYLIEQVVKRHIKETPFKTYPQRAQGLINLIFPTVAFILTLFAQLLLVRLYTPLRLLHLVNALLLALIVLRLIVNLLAFTFRSKQQWLRRSERWFISVIWVLFALHVAGLLTPTIGLLESISFRYGKTIITLWDIIQTLVVVALTLLISLSISQAIETRLLRSATGNISMRVVITRLIKASVLVIAFMIALPSVGIDLTVLSVFGGALGVGLGFGLQKIASNYVSGFILLIDRALRIGDMIQIDKWQGQVEGLTARYIILKALDNTVTLIPNDNFISTAVINKTYNGKKVAISLTVLVDYKSDIECAMQLMLKATEGLERILDTPAPSVNVIEFTENGVKLELGMWIADLEKGVNPLKSKINQRIWHSFKANGINFAYPYIPIINSPGLLEK